MKNQFPAKYVALFNRFGKPALVILAAILLANFHFAHRPSGDEGDWLVFGEFLFVYPIALVISIIGAVIGRGKVRSFFLMAILAIICFAATMFIDWSIVDGNNHRALHDSVSLASFISTT